MRDDIADDRPAPDPEQHESEPHQEQIEQPGGHTRPHAGQLESDVHVLWRLDAVMLT